MSARNGLADIVVQVAASNVKHECFDETGRETLAPELLSTHRAARIPPLENIDSQRSLAFQHAHHCATRFALRVR